MGAVEIAIAVFGQYHRGLTELGSPLGSSPGKHLCQKVSNEDHPSSSQGIARVFAQEFLSMNSPASSPVFFHNLGASISRSNGPFLATPEIARAYFNWVLSSDASAGPLTKLFNDLRNAAIQEYPELEVIPRFLQGLGLPPPQFSGSGSTFFLAFKERETCESMASFLASKLDQCSEAKENLISIVTTQSVLQLL